MPNRDLHVVCYDVAQPRRLAAALKLARRYSTSGQKTAQELFLTPAERDTLVADVKRSKVDMFVLVKLLLLLPQPATTEENPFKTMTHPLIERKDVFFWGRQAVFGQCAIAPTQVGHVGLLVNKAMRASRLGRSRGFSKPEVDNNFTSIGIEAKLLFQNQPRW